MQTVVTAARLWNRTGLHQNPLILIEDGRIHSVTSRESSELPDGARVLDYPGATLGSIIFRRALPWSGGARRNGSDAVRPREDWQIHRFARNCLLPRHHGHGADRYSRYERSTASPTRLRSFPNPAAPGRSASILKDRSSRMRSAACIRRTSASSKHSHFRSTIRCGARTCTPHHHRT